MEKELPADKYNPLENEGQSELHDFEEGAKFGHKSQQYAPNFMECVCDAEESLNKVKDLPSDLEKERQKALSHIESLKDNLTSDDWEI